MRLGCSCYESTFVAKLHPLKTSVHNAAGGNGKMTGGLSSMVPKFCMHLYTIITPPPKFALSPADSLPLKLLVKLAEPKAVSYTHLTLPTNREV